jgi:2-polyprenyl-3-methyl-5-hydroxy-6-metoxy-1,4-benzoquinol methylase
MTRSETQSVPHDAVIAGNVYDKYETRNPVARRLMAGFDRGMFELLAGTGRVASVLEVGCGEGHVTAKLARTYPGARILGTDVSEEIVAQARRLHPELAFQAQSIYDLDRMDQRFELIVACEVMEHLDDPDAALAAIARARPRFLFVSVPREPVWRVLNVLRGRYLGALGNTPGHVQHWSRTGFLRTLERRVEVLAVRSPLPWTQALCRPKPVAS